MDYNHISSFFDRFKKTLFKNEEYYDGVCLTIRKHISSPIDKKSIKIKNDIIYIQSSPIIRNEVLIHKTGILNDLSSIFPDKKFSDIR
jgi:hypothetical protein